MGSRNRFKPKQSRTTKSTKSKTSAGTKFNPNAPSVTGNTYKGGKLETNETKGGGVDWKKVGNTLTDAGDLAGSMAKQHRAANSGLTSSSAFGDFGAGQSYDTTPHTATRRLNKKTDNWEY